jgi:DNA-directed RNA polymerase subunit RPC12/RpoP
MGSTEDEVYCRNCSELLFRIVRHDDGTTQMKESSLEPESDGVQKYYRCPTCRGKNLVMLIDEPSGTRYYEIAGFSRA